MVPTASCGMGLENMIPSSEAFPRDVSHQKEGATGLGMHFSDSQSRSGSAASPGICQAADHVAHAVPTTVASRLALVLEAAFLVFSAGLLLTATRFGFGDMVGDFSITFLGIVVEAVPFMLLGTFVGGLVEAFVPRALLTRALEGRQSSSVFLAAGLGIIFPVCECAIVPVVRRLIGKGVPFPAAVAFLLAAPIVNPVVASSTAIAYRFDWMFVGTRLVCGYIIAVGIAFFLQKLWRRVDVTVPYHNSNDCSPSCCHHVDDVHGRSHGFWSRLGEASRHGCDDFFEVGKFLIIGAFVAAGLRTLVGLETFVRIGDSPGMAIAMMMCLAMVLNLCSEADAFVAYAFRGVMPYSAQMAFLVLGPMLDIKLMLLYGTVFKKRMIVSLAISVFAAVLGCMLLLHYTVGESPFGK